MKSTRSPLGPLLLGLALCACDSGREPLPNATVYAVHAAPSYATITFQRESLGEEIELGFGGAARRSFEADQYDFHVEVTPPGESPMRIATISHTLSAEREYYMMLIEAGGTLDPVVVEEPAFTATAGVAEFSLFHAAAALGAVDVYLEAPDADPAAATPLGSLGFGERIEPAELDPGEYRLTLTEPGNPANVLFRSPALTAAAGQDNMLVVTDEAGRTAAAAGVTRVSDQVTTVPDIDAPSAVRVVNAANDRTSRDVFVDEDFTAPLFAGLPFAAATDFATVTRAEHSFTLTPAGNPGVVEFEYPLPATGSAWYTFLFNGNPSEGLDGVHWPDERRRLADTARVRLVNAAARLDALDILIVPPGADLQDAEQAAQLGNLGLSAQLFVPPGDYELALRLAEAGTIIAGPTPITLEARGLYTAVALDGPDATSAELLLLDDFQ